MCNGGAMVMEMRGARYSIPYAYGGCAARMRRNRGGSGTAAAGSAGTAAAAGRRRGKLNSIRENANGSNYESRRCVSGWRVAKMRMAVSKAASKGFSSSDNVKLSDKVSARSCVARIGNDDDEDDFASIDVDFSLIWSMGCIDTAEVLRRR